jgi:GAF domain-containing protein
MIRSGPFQTFQTIINAIQDFYYNRASSAPGFLKLVLALRFGVLLILTINFSFVFRVPTLPVLKYLAMAILWLYFFYSVNLLFLAFFRQDRFEHVKTRSLQIVVDSAVISCFYWLSTFVYHQPDSNLFSLYFLPMFIAARFFDLRIVFRFLGYVFLTSGLSWLMNLEAEDMSSPLFWFRSLLPHYGFLLILTFFYLIYYRRRKMGERLQTMALAVEDQLSQLWQGWFSVDRDRRITTLDSAMGQRHGFPPMGTTCSEVICRLPVTNGLCKSCPIGAILNGTGSVLHKEMMLVGTDEISYKAQIIVQPIVALSHELVGASVLVQDLDERRRLHQKQRMIAEDLERVIDQNRQEDRARLQTLAQQLEAMSQASESALASDLFRGADEIVNAMVLMLGCRLATVRQYQVEEGTGQAGLVLCNHFGIEPADVERMSFLDLSSSSLVVKAFSSGEVQYVEDLQSSGQIEFEGVLRRYNLRSMACFPLKAHGKMIGTFTLFRNRRQGFSEGDIQLGRALANIMATLVASQQQIDRDHHESKRRRRELDSLNLLSQKLVTIDNPQRLAQLVADTVRVELHAETAAIFLKHDGSLRRVAISGIEADWFEGESYQIGQGLTGQTVLSMAEIFGNRMLDNNVENSELVVHEHLLRYAQRLASGTVRHLLAVPLNGLEGTFGVLRVVNKLDRRDRLDKAGFSEQEAELMTTMGCMAAVAMENARLFEMEKKKRLVEQALRQCMRNLSSTLDEKTILETILEQLRKVVEYDSASLFLQEEDGLRLKVMAGFSEEDTQKLRNICLDPDINPPFQRMKASYGPILVNDLWAEPLLEPINGTAPIRSWIGAPLILKDQIIGWLSVDHWLPDKYSQEDVEIAQNFAQQAAIAIDNAHQYRLQAEQIQFLMKLDQRLVEISSATDKKQTMDLVARAASQLLDCEMAGVALYDKEKKEIRALPGVGYVGVPDEYARGFCFSLDQRGGEVVQQNRVVDSGNALSDAQSIFGQRWVRPIGAQGVIAAPLLVGEHIVGILYAASPSPRHWTEAQRAFFSILGKHAAIAIRNSELLDARERRAQLLDLLHNLSIAGQLINEPEVIHNVLLTAVTAEYGLRFNRALLLLYDKELKVLKGFTGIGQLEKSEAIQVWEALDDRSHSFENYIQDVLSHGISSYTALHYKAKNLEIPIRAGANDVFSQVFQNRKTQLVNPADQCDRLPGDFCRVFDANPFVVVPLLVNNEVMGMLVIDNKMSGDPIRAMELDLLESCASQAAAAIYRSNLHGQVEQRVHVMEHLQQLAQAFSELAEPRQVLERIAAATNEVLHADISYLVPYDPQKGELLVEGAVTAGAKTDFQHEGTFSTYGLTSLALQEAGGLVVIEDLKAHRDLRSRFAEQEGVHSVAVCRLELRKNIVGMLYVNYRRHHWFSELELNTLRMLAGQSAVAINNARLLLQNEALATQRERNRLREDLHDVLNTYAFKVMQPAESIFEKEHKKRRRNPQLEDEAEELWRFSRHTYQQLERILQDMRDPVLVECGLPEALKALIVSSGLPGVNLSIRGEVRPSADVELVLYRICQEAISNIRKHAKLPREAVESVRIILELGPQQTELLVQDFGVGFSPQIQEDRKKGMGLKAMRNWARKVRAQYEITSLPGKGTTLKVVVPSSGKESPNG